MHAVSSGEAQHVVQFLRALRDRYTLALSSIAIVALGSFFFLNDTIVSQERLAAAINIAGRQRMLSQRIALTASELRQEENPADHTAQLLAMVQRMRNAHNALLNGDEQLSPVSSAVRALYLQGDHPLDQRLRVYFAQAEAAATGDMRAIDVVVSMAMRDILTDLDNVVNALQAESDSKVARLERVHLTMLCVTFVLLGALALWVFRPMRKRALALFNRCVELSHEQTVKDAQLKAAASVQMRARLSALGELAGGVAHEINNPLLIVQGTVARLSSTDDDQFSSARLALGMSTIEAMVDRMSHVVRGLMLFAQETDSTAFQMVDAEDIIESVAELCHARFTRHGVTLQIGAVDPNLTLECQRVQLTDAIVNLLLNAFSAVSQQETRWIRLECTTHGDQVEIGVTDSGAGIALHIRDKIMNPFFTTKPVGQGVGLGLAITFGTVEAHGGTLFLDDTSKHTRFVIRLPRLQAVCKTA